MANILCVEDDRRVAELLKRGLEEFNHTVTLAFDAQMGLRLFRSLNPELVISDIVLPGMSGFELVAAIKQSERPVAVIMLSALGETGDKLEGFDAGADDYMVKPFDIRELDARIRILLRRSGAESKGGGYRELRYDDLRIDLLSGKVWRGETEINLTPKEFALLSFMVSNPERILSRAEIAEKVWNTHFDTGTNFIDVYINYLRKKIDRGFTRRLIHTKTGQGFILTSQDED